MKVNNKDQELFRDNCIEQTLRAAYGYEDEQLLDEFQRAQAQPDDPNLIPPADEFQKIWARIQAEKPEGEKQTTESKVVRIRKMRKRLALVAVLCVLMMSMGIIANGDRQLNYWSREISEGKSKQIWNNYNDVIIAATEKEAYEAIEEKLGIEAIELWYTPQGLEFIEAEIVFGQARLEFSYQKQRIQLYEVLYDMEDSTGTVSDRNVVKTVYNKWLEQEIPIEKRVLPNGKAEYGAKVEMKDARYSIGGIIEEKEFLKMVENLKFYE